MVFSLSPHIMASHPICKKVPTTKLSADNASELELSSHRTVIAELTAAPSATPAAPSASSALVPAARPATADVAPAAPSSHLVPSSQAPSGRPQNSFIPNSDTESTPLTPTDAAAPSRCLAPPTRVPKRPRNPFILRSDSETDPEVVPDDHPAPNPKAKKVKKSVESTNEGITGLHADVSIISIDDVDDPRDERLNKTDPTADIREFFIAVPPGPGETKTRMKCNLCAYVSSFFLIY